MKNNLSLKYISLLTVIILSLYTILSVFSLPVFIGKTEAASIDKDDIYTGLGVALLIYFLSEITKSEEESEKAKVQIYENYDEKAELLARIINAEARGEPYDGQIAVGAVVLNRKESTEFPDNINDVIYQKGQFTSVENGQINLTPTPTSYNAAYDAMNGKDPSNGALYFYNPDKAKTLWWLSSRKVTAKIGDHVFAK